MNHVKRKYPPVRNIGSEERIGIVKEIFSTITGRYDFLNRLLSLRRDIYWRRFTAQKMIFFHTNRLLDVACGTGDLSILSGLIHQNITITGVDFIYEMLHEAKRKTKKKGLTERIRFIQGNALKLPFADNTFDVTAMAFGIRNIPQKKAAIKEMMRVTVPGGQIMILEMNFIQNRFFKVFYYLYLNHLLPLLARLASQNAAAYYYLADSIMNFPPPRKFAQFLHQVGLSNIRRYPLTFGITCLYLGEKSTQ
jgi:demethylmenaquinone methyltransferase/2-methoxy-6-polyprenyl-1,4-benzoquinol methylase